jgi:hypothetical protein
MGDVTVKKAVSLLDRAAHAVVVWHATNTGFSNNALVSGSWPAEFFRRCTRGYDRDHQGVL